MQAHEPDDDKRGRSSDDDELEANENHEAREGISEFSKSDSLGKESVSSIDPDEARSRRQWMLNDKIKSHFVVHSGDSAEHFLEVFRIDKLHDFIHHELGHGNGEPIHAMHVADSQEKFMEHLNKNVQVFLDADPSIAQVRKFLSIPMGLKLTLESLREYSGISDLGEDPHGMADYYWNKTAGYVYDTVIPKVDKIEDLFTLVNLDLPNDENMEFGRCTRGAVCSAVERGFEIGGEDLTWMHKLKGFDDAINLDSVEHPLPLLKEAILDVETKDQNDHARTSRVVKMLCGDYLQQRLLSGTEGGATLSGKWDEHLRQPVLKEAPEDSIRHELSWHREFLFKYLLGRQNGGFSLPLPQSEIERREFKNVAQKSGYVVTIDGDKFTLTFHSIENYGSDLWSIASNVRKRLREGTFETASDFVSHFDPARLPKITSVPHQEYGEASEAKIREWKLQELISIVFFEELERQLPRLHELNPSPRVVRSLLELQNKVPYDFRDNPDAFRAHDKMMWDLFDRYLGNAKSIQDWTTIITYRTIPAHEFEVQQQYAFNTYFWKAVQLGDEGMMWMAYDVWGNRSLAHKFNETNTIRTAFEDLEDDERTDGNMIRRAISLIQGSFLREQAKEKIAHDPINEIRVALASAASGIPKKEFDTKEVDPVLLEKVERYQKGVLVKYLMARQAAGASIEVPDTVLSSFAENIKKLGFELTLDSQQELKDGIRFVNIQKTPTDTFKNVISRTAGSLGKAIAGPIKFIGHLNGVRKRGWW